MANQGVTPEAGREREAGREMDGQVAVKVFGWRWIPSFSGQNWLAPPTALPSHGWGYGLGSVPHYTLDTDSDYEVLRHVRDHWTGEQLRRMADRLAELWGQESEAAHAGAPTLNYQPGDYSRAALAALSTEDR